MKYQCPICGKSTDYKEELEGLCIECYRKKYQLVIRSPIRISIKGCPICGRVHYGKTWLQSNRRNLILVLLHQLKTLKNFRGYDLKIRFHNSATEFIENLFTENEESIIVELYRGSLKLQEIRTLVNIQKQVCPICMRKQTGAYFEYVIHVRFPRKKIREYLEKTQRIINIVLKSASPEDVVDVKKVPSGLDIRVSSRSLGRKLINALMNSLTAEYREYTERKFDPVLNKQVTIHKAIIEV